MSPGRAVSAWLLATAWCAIAAAQPAPGPAPAPTPSGAPTYAPPAAPTYAPPAAPTYAPPAAAPGYAPPAAAPTYGPPPAQPAPPPAATPESSPPAWWSSYRPTQRSGGAKLALELSGAVIASLGTMTLLAAGVTALTAWTHSLDLEDECPNHYCVEGTRGGDAYEATRDLSNATDVLLGVALPAIGGGLSLVILGAGMRGSSETASARTTVRTTGQGVSLEVTF